MSDVKDIMKKKDLKAEQGFGFTHTSHLHIS